MRISLVTLGCKVNQFESQALEESLSLRGHSIVPFGEPADAVIVNSCTVTHRSDRDARALVRRARKANPSARLVVTGCYAQTEPEALRALGVDVVVGMSEKGTIPGLLEDEGGSVPLPDPARAPPLAPSRVSRFPGRARALLKVQDGCDAFCAYCIVPHARGPSRSLCLEDVREGLEGLRLGGHREVVLTGVHLGMWGRDLHPPKPFAELLTAAEASGIPRIRLSSLEPREVTGEVVRRMAESRSLCPHLHIPLQSGSDRILRAMGRPYTAEELRCAVAQAAGEIPGLCVGFDVIVGFPGEDEAAFRETLGLLEELPFCYLHVFPFSPRKGTRAWGLPERVPDAAVRERAAVLRELSQSRSRSFREGQQGRRLWALAEGEVEAGLLRVTTRNYLTVRIPWQGPPPKDEVEIELTAFEGGGIGGRLAGQPSEG